MTGSDLPSRASQSAERLGYGRLGAVVNWWSLSGPLAPALSSERNTGGEQSKDFTVTKALDGEREEAFLNATGVEQQQFGEVNRRLTDWMKTKIASAEQVVQDASAKNVRVFGISLLLIALLTLTVGGLGVGITRSIVRPIEVLKGAAARIANRQTVRDIGVHSRDELGDLARSMEAMSTTIHNYYTGRLEAAANEIRQLEARTGTTMRLALQQEAAAAEIRELNASLEGRGAERTAELEQAVNELRTAKEAAAGANRAKSEFLARMIHDLNHERRESHESQKGVSNVITSTVSLNAQAGM